MASTSLLRRAVAAAPVPAARARRLRRGARRGGRGGGAAAAADDADSSSSSWDDGDTIAAIATPVVPQAGGVAIIRLSGPNAVAATRAVFRPAAKAERDAQRRGDPMVSHTALYGDVRDPRDGKVIDEVLVLPMLAPRSYTTEDVVEIHAHGGSVCVQRVLALLLRNGDETFKRSDAGREAGDDEKGDDAEEPAEEPAESVPRAEESFVRVRLARPGEFTLRAFLNGRLDLTQAEAVHGLVSARTAAAADGALSALRGGLAGPVRRARREAVELLAELEARLDFDDALEPLDETRVSARVSRLRDAVQSVLNTAERGRLRETGVSVAIVGRPNAGKSSLLNAWSRSDKAIVTDIAGTTRDVVEASVVVAGVPVTLLDTAGIRSDTRGDAVEAIGVERSLAAAKGADAVLLVVDARSGWADEDREVWERLLDVSSENENESEETEAFEDEFENARARLYATRGGLERFATERKLSPNVSETNDSNDAFNLETTFSETVSTVSCSKRSDGGERRVPLLLALNKMDAVPEKERARKKADVPRDVLDASDAVVETSATTRAGLDALEAALAAFVGAGEIDAEGAQWAANQRQAEALRVAAAALARLAETVEDGLPVDFWTIELREAAAALGEITGEDVAEDVLDVVFTKFCIGK